MPKTKRDSNNHKNNEKTVLCPVCDDEVLARGLHLHVMRSSNDGHGERGEVPDNIDLEEAEEAGTAEVEMNYPEQRDTEQIARLCPYCERPYRGKHGVMIHLGQVEGRKDHPKNATEKHDPSDFAIVEVDENENVTEIVDEGTMMPSTERRRSDSDTESLNEENIQAYIDDLREQGKEEEARRAEQMLLGN